MSRIQEQCVDSHEMTPRQSPDHFDLFELEIERIGDSYRARVTASPIRKTKYVRVDLSHFDLENPFELESVEASRGGERHARSGGFDPETLEDWGRALFKATFVGELGSMLESSIRQVRVEGKGLRLALRLDEVPELAKLPWESMGDAMSGGVFNGRLDFLVGRTLNVVKARKPLFGQTAQKLRLLGLLPRPEGQDELSGVDEWQKLEELLVDHLETGVLDARRIDPPTLQELGAQIDQAPCHILHVVAHGEPGSVGKGGVIHLENAEGKSDPIAGVQFIQALTSRELPRLVVLNSCYGAMSSPTDAFDGLAQCLLREGVLAVVAMRTAISDDAALTFAKRLYSQLVRGRTIESALAEARRDLALGEHRSEWATPVLYSRGENLKIFKPAPRGAGVGLVEGTGGLGGYRAFAGFLGTLVVCAALWFLVSVSVPHRPEVCPAPAGLKDLRFVEIRPGVVDLGDRKVVVNEAFCIATKEVTRRDWVEVMGGDLRPEDWPMDWPLTHVTLEEAKAFTRQLGERDPGVVYRLPTEVEWEFAARAEAETSYSFGDDKEELHHHGNCRNLLVNDGYEGPAPVGSFTPNPLGLYDVHGNAAEWVLAQDLDQEGKFLRLGGSFEHTRENCSFNHRRWVSGVSDRNTGFRVVRQL